MDDVALDLRWLAGITDGEGAIGIYKVKKKSCTDTLKPCVEINNSNPLIINEVRRILDRTSIAYWVGDNSHNEANHKRVLKVRIDGLKRSLRLLWILEPHLVGKQRQAQIVMAFIASRLGQTNVRTRYPRDIIHPHNMPYTIDELDAVMALGELNHRGSVILNEYTPKVTQWVTKMYSELRAKGAEAAEMSVRSN